MGLLPLPIHPERSLLITTVSIVNRGQRATQSYERDTGMNLLRKTLG